MDRLVIVALIAVLCHVCATASPAALGSSKSEVVSSSTTKSRVGEQRSGALIYPNELNQSGTLNRGNFPDAPPAPCPNGALFCESADDYPEDIIKRKLKKQPKLLLDLLYEEEVDDTQNKFGPESETEKELCTSTAQIKYPNKGQTNEGVFEFIVNDNENRQGIRVETCTNNGGECNELPAHILPLGYKSKCVQKYIIKTLVIFNRNSSSDAQGFVTKPFEFPSCCSCVITMNVPGYDRIGEADTTPAIATSTARSTSATVKDKQKV